MLPLLRHRHALKISLQAHRCIGRRPHAYCAFSPSPSLADHRVLLYAFDTIGGAIRFEPDLSCPYLCREHAADNEQRARGERGTDVRVVYPYTNQGGEHGLSIYLDLLSSDAA